MILLVQYNKTFFPVMRPFGDVDMAKVHSKIEIVIFWLIDLVIFVWLFNLLIF